MESIARLMRELPKDYEEESVMQGALIRKRGVTSAANLMMLSMFHLMNGCTLMEISEVTRITKMGQMSDVAFMNRFEKCGDWFKAINAKLMGDSMAEYTQPSWMNGKTVVAVDASDVVEKGRSGRLYRLHYALDLFKMNSIEQKITTGEVGESLRNFTLKSGHLVIADRAYSTITGIEHCNINGAEYILRMRTNSFTLRDTDGKSLNMPALLAGIREETCLDIHAYATNLESKKVPVRICAMRKPPEAIVHTHEKLRRKESKKQCIIAEDTKVFHEYIVVVTNLDHSATAQDILATYRLRWQVEIQFKRLKSIMDLGDLPKRRPNSVIAWLNGKILIALLIEQIIAKASFPPPCNEEQEHLA